MTRERLLSFSRGGQSLDNFFVVFEIAGVLLGRYVFDFNLIDLVSIKIVHVDNVYKGMLRSWLCRAEFLVECSDFWLPVASVSLGAHRFARAFGAMDPHADLVGDARIGSVFE